MTWLLRTPFTGMGLVRREQDPIASLHRDINRAFDDLMCGFPAAQTSSMGLRLDVKEDDTKFQITADLPGLSEKDVEITFDDGLLTLRGEKKIERDEKKDTWHVVERSYGSFARQLSLPVSIDVDKIEAKFDKGVLTVTLPKLPQEETKAKKIEIKVN